MLDVIKYKTLNSSLPTKRRPQVGEIFCVCAQICVYVHMHTRVCLVHAHGATPERCIQGILALFSFSLFIFPGPSLQLPTIPDQVSHWHTDPCHWSLSQETQAETVFPSLHSTFLCQIFLPPNPRLESFPSLLWDHLPSAPF